ncbi:MAG: hypothetical protein ACLVG6_02475 [Dorea formicigenerans]
MMLFKKFTNENASEKVTVKERLAYGCGDFSSNDYVFCNGGISVILLHRCSRGKCKPCGQKVSLRNL